MRLLVEKHIATLDAYVPGKPVAFNKKDNKKKVIKLSSNENPFGPSPFAIEAIRRHLKRAHIYPILDRYALKEKICLLHNKYSTTPDNIILGNGVNELIVLLVRAFLSKEESILIGWPSFIVYRLAARIHDRGCIEVPLCDSFNYDLNEMAQIAKSNKSVKMIFLANPNNPTGKYITKIHFDDFVKKLPEDLILVLDEAYAEYVCAEDFVSGLSLIKKRGRVVVLRTFSKIFGLAGLRIGYAICDPAIVSVLHKIRDPFNVNGLALVAAKSAIDDSVHIKRSMESNLVELEKLKKGVLNFGLDVTPSVANFILMHLGSKVENVALFIDKLGNNGALIRPLSNYGLKNYARVTVGNSDENLFFLDTLAKTLDEHSNS